MPQSTISWFKSDIWRAKELDGRAIKLDGLGAGLIRARESEAGFMSVTVTFGSCGDAVTTCHLTKEEVEALKLKFESQRLFFAFATV